MSSQNASVHGGGRLRGARDAITASPDLPEQVAADRTVDDGPVATELACDRVDRHLGVEQAEEGAAVLQGEVAVGHDAKGSIVQDAAEPTKSHFALECTRLHNLLQPS